MLFRSSISATQTGNNSNFYANVLGTANQLNVTTTGGAYNSVTATQNGQSNQATINVSGGGNNQVTVEQGVGGSAISFLGLQGAQSNDNGIVNLTVVGASNTVEIGQTSAGNYSDTSVISLTGTGNTLNLLQNAAAGNTTVNLQSKIGRAHV